MHVNFDHKLTFQLAKPPVPAACGTILVKQRSPVRLDVPTAGASIFWYLQVNPVNILRQAADATVYGTSTGQLPCTPMC